MFLFTNFCLRFCGTKVYIQVGSRLLIWKMTVNDADVLLPIVVLQISSDTQWFYLEKRNLGVYYQSHILTTQVCRSVPRLKDF